MISVNDVSFQRLLSKLGLFFISSLITIWGLLTHAEPLPPAPVNTANSFLALCYHDVNAGFIGNSFSIRKKDLEDQFDYLKAHYNVVSLQDIIDANHGKKNLPPKAVLITVDDGLDSFYDNVYPLLKAYKFPAVFAIVGKWTEDGAAPDYGFKDTNPKMASWKQIKEMMHSGLVEIVSHSYDLHQGQIFNPQGNQAAMAGFFRYDRITKSYQSEEDFSNLIRTDIAKNNALIKKQLGKDNIVMVWPYGKSNGLSRKAAADAGIKIQMSLQPGLNYASDISHIGRGLVVANMDVPKFAAALERAFVDPNPLRMIRVDLDSFWKKTETETEQGLGDILEDALALGSSGALVQAVSDSGEAYFPTTAMKVHGDYLSRAAHTIKNRAMVSFVYARLPQSVLKNPEKAAIAVRDIAKYTDVDGIFFEVSAKEKLNEIPFDSLMAAGRAMAPHMQYGLIGQMPLNGLFDYVMLTPKQIESEKAMQPAPAYKPAQQIVSLSKDYTLDASHLMAQGYQNLFYDVNFKGFAPDADFKNLFSVVHPHDIKHIKGEAK